MNWEVVVRSPAIIYPQFFLKPKILMVLYQFLCAWLPMILMCFITYEYYGAFHLCAWLRVWWFCISSGLMVRESFLNPFSFLNAQWVVYEMLTAWDDFFYPCMLPWVAIVVLHLKCTWHMKSSWHTCHAHISVTSTNKHTLLHLQVPVGTAKGWSK